MNFLYEEGNKNSKFYFNPKIEDMNEIKFNSKILNIAICPEISSILISKVNNLYSIYSYQELLTQKQKNTTFKEKYNKILPEVEELIKFINKKNNKVQIEPIFELNPYFDEGTSMAIGINKTVMVAISSKKDSLYEIEHWEKCNCIFIQWEHDEYDLLICAFENKKIKIIKNRDVLNELLDDDMITSMKSIHYQNYKLLITGYNKKVKIRNFYSILYSSNEFQPYLISKLEGKIDIIEYKNPYILFCSKKNKIIYCYRFMDNNWRPIHLFEIYKFRDIEEEQEIINVKFITNEGIIVSFTNKIYMYYIKNNREEFNSIAEARENIYFSSILYYRTNYYFLCVLKKKIKIVEIKIEEINNLLECSDNSPENNKELINTIINTLLNRKNEFKLKKVDDRIINAEMEDIILRIEFSINDLSTNISIIKCEDYKLKCIIEDELEKFNKNNEVDSLTEKLIKLNEIIKSTNLGDTHSEEYSEINKLKKELFLEYYNFVKNWQEITKKKTPVNNLYKEEEEFDSYNKTMLSSLKELVNWDFSYENLTIDKAFSFVNSSSNDLSSPNLFYFSKETEQYDDPFYSPLINKKNRRTRKKSTSTSEVPTIKEEAQKLNESFELKISETEETNDDKKGILYKLTKETFNNYINKINKNINYGDIICLLEVLGQIKYYIQEIINQKSSNLANLYVLNILDIITLLESQLKIEFLFICILPISSIIYSEITKEMRRKDPILNKSRLTAKDSQDNRINNSENELKPVKNFSGILSSSESNDELNDDNQNTSDFILNTEEVNNSSINNNLYRNYINEFKNDNKLFDSSKDNFFSRKKYSKNSVDLTKSYRKLPGYRNNMSFLSISNKNDKSFIELFGANFCNTIIDYVKFFSEELKQLDNDSANNNLIDFFILINKYYETHEIINEINEITKKIYM